MVLTKINHVNELKDQGYTILRNVLDPETDIQPLINENVQVLKSLIKSLNNKGKSIILTKDLKALNSLVNLL